MAIAEQELIEPATKMPRAEHDIDRFAKFVSFPENGCWEWAGHKTPEGYGRFEYRDSSGKRRTQAHCFAFERYIGPIPDGAELDHLRRNPSCVNPYHLEPVSRRENVLRGQSFPALNARKTACIHGHPFDEGNTYRGHIGWRACRACNRERARAYRARRIA